MNDNQIVNTLEKMNQHHENTPLLSMKNDYFRYRPKNGAYKPILKQKIRDI